MSELPEGVVAAVIYNRVSHAKRSISVEDQDRANHAWCAQIGLPVRKVFTDDGISASRHGGKVREDWEQLKTELRSGDMLVVWAASRSARDLEEFVELRNLCAQLGVPFSYSGRVLDFSRGDDRFYGGLDALVAERDSEEIKRNVLRGKTNAAAFGYPPSRAPWGYRTLPRNEGDPPRWEQDPVEAPRIREAVDRLLDGDTMYSVMRWLERTEGVTPTSLTNLKRGLTNPALAGLRVHRGTVTGKGTWHHIITEKHHHDLVNQLKRAPGPRVGREPKHLLTGISKCGKCGDGMRWKGYPGKRDPRYECYRGHVSREATAMEAAVEDTLFDLIPVIAAALPTEILAPNTKEAERKIADLEDTLEEWRQAAIAGSVTPGSFATIEQGLLAQIEALRPKTPPKFRLPDPKTFRKEWPTWSVRERRDQIRFWLDVTVVPAERRGARTGQLVIKPGGEAALITPGW
jgi:site-specific DNA recombinase